jgi:hypothetical protein
LRRPGLIAAVGLAFLATGARAHDPTPAPPPHDKTHGSLGDVGAKLSDPTSNVWALFTEFDLSFSDGDLNQGDDRLGGAVIFQPILPVPLYGEGKEQWKVLTRPTLPFVFSQAIPRTPNEFFNVAGIGDMTLPLPLTPPPEMTGHWIMGLGPAFLFPTATRDELGQDQFAFGPTGILGYKTKDFTVGVFPQYYYKIGSVGNQTGREPINSMNLLYFAFLNLPDAWQVGFAPTITYNRRQERENRWNVPIGLTVTKTTAIAKKPVKFQFAFEYSVVSEDDFGKRFLVRFNVIPVIQALVSKPIFGGF